MVKGRLALTLAISASMVVGAQAQNPVQLPKAALAKVQIYLRTFSTTHEQPQDPGFVIMSCGGKFWNGTTYELTSITIEMQIFDSSGTKIEHRKEVLLEDFSDYCSGYAGNLLPYGGALKYMPAAFPAALQNRAYWAVVKSARGYAKSDDLNNTSRLMAEVARGGLANVRRHIAAKPSALNAVEPRSGCTLTHIAAANDMVDLMKFFRSKGADLRRQNKMGFQAIHMAASGDCAKAIKYLIAQGIKADSPIQGGYIPLQFAAKWGCLNAAKALLAAGAKINHQAPNGETALTQAVQGSSTEMIKFLISRKANLHLHTATGATALHVAVFNRYHPEHAETLLKAGANPNAGLFKHEPWTPLHTAANMGRVEIARILLKHGANPKIKNSHGQTPLQVAEQFKQSAVAEILRQAMRGTKP